MSKWAIPNQIAIVTEIPKTSVGKLDKKRIRVDIIEWQANNSTFLSTLDTFRRARSGTAMLYLAALLVICRFSAILAASAFVDVAKGLWQTGR